MTKDRKPGWWLPMVYYYLATAIGLVVVLVGLVGGLRGLVTAAVPEISSDVRYSSATFRPGPNGQAVELSPDEKAAAKADAVRRARLGGYADALYGGVTALVGAPVFVWHLRQARRKEPAQADPAP